MDTYDPKTVYSSIDHAGRYAYANQGKIGQWNLTSLAECLLPLLGEDEKKAASLAQEIISEFPSKFTTNWLRGMRGKLGLIMVRTEDAAIVQQLLDLMQKHGADYTLVFRQLCGAVKRKSNIEGLNKIFSGDSLLVDWLDRWHQRLEQEATTSEEVAENMRRINPIFIPRNHLIEQAINSAVEKNDFSMMDTLQELLASPYTDQPSYSKYSNSPKSEERVYQTFCGT
jgi:uncharacterized protein YdiU (UPF0061 family)